MLWLSIQILGNLQQMGKICTEFTGATVCTTVGSSWNKHWCINFYVLDYCRCIPRQALSASLSELLNTTSWSQRDLWLCRFYQNTGKSKSLLTKQLQSDFSSSSTSVYHCTCVLPVPEGLMQSRFIKKWWQENIRFPVLMTAKRRIITQNPLL